MPIWNGQKSHQYYVGSPVSFYSASVILRQIKDQLHITGIQETLTSTREGIDDEIVQNILYTINLQSQAQAKLARRILALLTAAKEPMTAEAMCHALGMSDVLETQQLPRELDKVLIPEVGGLVKCCEGLVAIDPVTRLVTLAQDDIAECMRRQRSAYLSGNINETRARMDHFSYEEMWMLAAVSLAYLTMSKFEEGPCHQVTALRERLDEYPFLEYAARHWGYHVRELRPLPMSHWHLIENNIRILLRKAKNLEAVFQVRDLDADGVRLREAVQKGKEHNQVLDATQIRSSISALQVLSSYGLTGIVQDLLPSKPATSFERDSVGTSAIHEAAQAGWDDIVEILIEAGANPLSKDRNGKSPLYYAARNGCEEVISVLLGVNKMEGNDYELALAFFEAIEAGRTNVVVCLLGIVECKTVTKTSTTLISIRAGHLNIVETILGGGATFSSPDYSPSDQIPLHLAVRHGRADMAKLLLDHGADIQTRDDKGRNAIFETLKAPNTDGLSLLIDRGIRMDCSDGKGNTVLHQAAMDGPVGHARLLIHQDPISKNTFNNESLTPLHLAVRAQQCEIVDILIKVGKVDVKVVGKSPTVGWTPLKFAVVYGSMKICDTLIQNRAHVNADGSTDLVALAKLAAEAGQHTIGDMLMAERRSPRL